MISVSSVSSSFSETCGESDGVKIKNVRSNFSMGIILLYNEQHKIYVIDIVIIFF